MHSPPKFFLKFLRRYCRPDLLPSIEGDLIELYKERIQELGKKKANRLFIKDTLLLFRKEIIKPASGTQKLNYYGMFKNHLKIALRIFKREKMFTTINVLGLTAGIFCTIMISIWVKHEISYDDFHTKGSQIHLLLRNSGTKTSINTAYPIAKFLTYEFPEVVDFNRFSTPQEMILMIEKDFVKTNIAAADPNFFEFFSFPLIEGDKKTCLENLKSIVISDQLAQNYFEGKSPLDQTVTISESGYSMEFIVKGVFQIPENSSINFDALLPVGNYLEFHTYPNSWGNSWLHSYIMLDENSETEAVNEKIKDVPTKTGKADWFTLWVQPFEDVYLHSNYKNGIPEGGRIDNVVLYTTIAFFTLLIACFNFINLTTSKVSRRTPNIGIRKVMGAKKSTLIGQFLTECSLLVLASVILALILCKIFLPEFNAITAKNLRLDLLSVDIYIFIGGVILVTLLFSSIYPAIFLSSFHPINALKNTMKKNTGQILTRKILVTIQFGLSLLLISGTLVVLYQMSFIRNKDLGLDKENVLMVQTDFNTGQKYKSIKNDLLSHSSIVSVGATNSDFRHNPGMSSDPIWRNKSSSSKKKKWFAMMSVDYDLSNVLKLDFMAGRPFSSAIARDSTNFIINEKAARVMGFNDPIGEDLEAWGTKGKIIGVLKDFNFESLHAPIKPMIFLCEPGYAYRMYIRVAAGKITEALDHVEKVHKQYSGLPLNIRFLDQALDNGYQKEKRTQKLASYFTFLTIFISCLGLFGLASYTAERRIKEMAIRKILGANLAHLINLLFKEYLLLIIISFTIGLPLAYLWINAWLDGFAYKITVSWWQFLLPAGLIVAIAFITVSQTSIRTARTNPVDSLRDE